MIILLFFILVFITIIFIRILCGCTWLLAALLTELGVHGTPHNGEVRGFQVGVGAGQGGGAAAACKLFGRPD